MTDYADFYLKKVIFLLKGQVFCEFQQGWRSC